MISLLIMLASATPVTLNWQGRLLNTDGVPLDGPLDVELVLYPDAVTSTSFHTETVDPADVNDGFIAVRLGADSNNLLHSEDLMGGAWVQLKINDNDLGGRTELLSVPYAAVASQLDGPARLTDTSATCTGTTIGTLRFRNDTFEGCTSAGWQSLVTANSAGDVTVGGALGVTGNATVGGTHEVTGNATVGGTHEVTGNATVGGTHEVTGNATVGGTHEVTGNATVGGTHGVTGNANVAGSLTVVGDQVDGRSYYQNYNISTADSAVLLASMPSAWSAVVTCSVTGTGAGASSVWLLKRSSSIFLEKIASLNSTTSNTPQIYADGLDYRIRLYDHPNNYNVRCHFQEII